MSGAAETKVEFPPEPWELRGLGHGALWLVRDWPLAMPPGLRPWRIAGRWCAATVWVRYDSGGVLAYHEVGAGVAVSGGGRLGLHVTHMWVDSAASMAGGRQLWAIPKQRAEFSIEEEGASFSGQAFLGSQPFASLDFRRRWGLPFECPWHGWTLQSREGRLRLGELRAWGKASLGRGRWDFAGDGPLGFLAGRRPFCTLRIEARRILFGSSKPAP